MLPPRGVVCVAVILVASLSGICLADDDASSVVAYGSEFKEKVKENNHFVMFYAPW